MEVGVLLYTCQNLVLLNCQQKLSLTTGFGGKMHGQRGFPLVVLLRIMKCVVCLINITFVVVRKLNVKDATPCLI